MKMPEGWTTAPLLFGAIISLSLAAWLLVKSDHGELIASTLTAVGCILVGALIVDWARRH